MKMIDTAGPMLMIFLTCEYQIKLCDISQEWIHSKSEEITSSWTSFFPGCLQVSPSNSMAEFQNRLYFINAAEYMNFNSLAINTTLCCCRDAWQAERRLLPAPLPLSQQAADMFCSKICECRSPSSLKFCVSLLVEVTLTILHYIRATWKMGSESETAYCKR